ncbi:MAG TPA: Uma2 family endonuclease [Nitrospira sp.]|nr:Uma2 family endonuclease [Nitrospira sp.]
MMTAPAVQIKRWTRREYDRMAEAGLFGPDEQVELLEGEIITVTPQQSLHSACIGLIDGALRQAFGPSYWIRIQLPLIVDPDSEPEPDLAVVPGSPRDYVHDHPRTALLVVEVADSTIAKDRTYKTKIYARAGIQEYWIVNLAEHCLEVYRDPVAAPGPASLYRSSQKLTPSDSIAPLAATTATVAVADLLP